MFTNTLKPVCALLLIGTFTLTLIGCRSEQRQEQVDTTAIPYPLDTCIVTGEKLDADSDMKPYTFTYEGQEIKLCCKSCLKDFNKEPAKYLAKLKQPEATSPTQ